MHPLRLALILPALLSLACAGAPAAAPTPSPAERPPNIVVIFMDDLGYGDIGAFGAKGYATPNLDRMAQEGTRLTSFYAAQGVCSASRAGLLTGCYPNRWDPLESTCRHASLSIL